MLILANRGDLSSESKPDLSIVPDLEKDLSIVPDLKTNKIGGL